MAHRCSSSQYLTMICKKRNHIHIHISKVDIITSPPKKGPLCWRHLTTYIGKMTWQECVASADDKRAKQMKQEVVKSLLFPDEVEARNKKAVGCTRQQPGWVISSTTTVASVLWWSFSYLKIPVRQIHAQQWGKKNARIKYDIARCGMIFWTSIWLFVTPRPQCGNSKETTKEMREKKCEMCPNQMWNMSSHSCELWAVFWWVEQEVEAGSWRHLRGVETHSTLINLLQEICWKFDCRFFILMNGKI